MTRIRMTANRRATRGLTCILVLSMASSLFAEHDVETTRVFIFAGQSNMVGSDSRVEDIRRFPPFVGLETPQSAVKFSYCIGREDKLRSDGWVELQPVNNVVGPELSFARTVGESIDAPIAIIKCAAGGTHLGGDWNPDEPSGFEMYPLLLDLVRQSLDELDRQNIPYRLEGFMWHQGENDMFDEEYMAHYGENLENFIACARRDLNAPELNFYIGELCTKTIWGMDLRPRMYAISLGQRAVTEADPLAHYVPTAHIGVEIGGGVGLHYHYGTLGQLEHGVNYAEAYLQSIGRRPSEEHALATWPYPAQSTVKLFVLAGHRNMEGELAFTQELSHLPGGEVLLSDDPNITFRYSLGGGVKMSSGWEPLRPVGYYDTFGPELSFAATLQADLAEPIAILKFTHSGSQIIDWTPEGSEAQSRNLYHRFIESIQQAIADLEQKGHHVELAGIFYHVGENDMSFHPYRQAAAERLQRLITQSRIDLHQPELQWYISQQPPTDHEDVNAIDVVADIEALAAADPYLIHIKAFDLPEQAQQLVIDTEGLVALGQLLAREYLDRHQ